MKKYPTNSNRNTTIITSHTNADFDAVGSMIAAQKLYQNSITVFPGSNGKTMRDFFLKSVVYLLNIVEASKIDVNEVARLIIVDTRRRDRLGKLGYILNNKSIEVHIYDHHERRKDDISAKRDVYQKTGSTATILVNMIREQKITVSPEEATIMCMGIYEDTGSFLFPSTTTHDLQAASFLLSKGANLKVISSMLVREFSPEQIELLNEMIHSTKDHTINGLSVTITRITTNQYFHNLAFLVNKMLEIKRKKILFAIALMGNKTHIIARSKTENMNVAKIMEILGGGGHRSAATAVLKHTTASQAELILLKTLTANITPKYFAKNIMSSPPIIVTEKMTCRKAQNYLVRYNINALIITKDGTKKTPVVGYITRQILEKALFHGLDNIHVQEYMTTEFGIVSINAKIVEIKEKIIINKQRILPIFDKNNQIAGVITRTDLFNFLIEDNKKENVLIPKPYQKNVQTRTKFITSFMEERIEKEHLVIMIKLGNIASMLGYNIYVVGGFVRDLFLYCKNEDIDVVVEGNGILVAEKYAAENNVRVHVHKKFCSATIIITDSFKIDVATSRMEYYKFPASLPVVEMSSIKMDLSRRDFTINTLAIQLNPAEFGRLIDFFSGQKDIKNKIIRIIHNMSFVEDPTRVFRALRFEQRFDFTICKLTSSLIKNAVKMDLFERLSGQRIFTELKLIMQEQDPISTIIRLFDYNLIETILPEQENSSSIKSILSVAKSVTDWQDLLFMEEPYERWSVYFMTVMRNLNKSQSYQLCEKMILPKKYRTMFCSIRFDAIKKMKYLEKNEALSNSKIFKTLSTLKTEVILYIMILTKSEKVRKQISHYQTKLRNTCISISGKDLVALGLNPGPKYGQILEKLLIAKLDGKIKSRGDEVELVKSELI